MTKKDFIALADALRETRPERDINLTVQWDADRDALIAVCKADNPRFDEGRFKAWTEK